MIILILQEVRLDLFLVGTSTSLQMPELFLNLNSSQCTTDICDFAGLGIHHLIALTILIILTLESIHFCDMLSTVLVHYDQLSFLNASG